MMSRGAIDTYGRLNPSVIVSSGTLPSGRVVPLLSQTNDGVSVGYMTTSNSNVIDPNVLAYETAHKSDEASSSSMENAKNTYNSLLYRLPDGTTATIDKNYMTVSPELFQQDIYRKLNTQGGSWDESVLINDVQNDHTGKKQVLVVAHEGLTTVIQKDIELKPLATSIVEVPKKRCRFRPMDLIGKSERLTRAEAFAHGKYTHCGLFTEFYS